MAIPSVLPLTAHWYAKYKNSQIVRVTKLRELVLDPRR